MKITGGGLRESHPHNVTITREAPNYSGCSVGRALSVIGYRYPQRGGNGNG